MKTKLMIAAVLLMIGTMGYHVTEAQENEQNANVANGEGVTNENQNIAGLEVDGPSNATTLGINNSDNEQIGKNISFSKDASEHEGIPSIFFHPEQMQNINTSELMSYFMPQGNK